MSVTNSINNTTNTLTISSFNAGAVVTNNTGVTSAANGTSGQVLVANGAGVAPTFQTIAPGGVTSVTGTTNEITASPTTGAVVLTIPATFIGPGSIASTTTNTAGTDFITTNGNVKIPTTTSTVGQYMINNVPVLHAFNGGNNIFVGDLAGNFTLSGTNMVGVGNFALNGATTTTGAVAVGYQALIINTGDYNIGIGYQAANHLTSGTGHTVVGAGALNSAVTSTNNTVVGYRGITACTGSHNSTLGYQVGATLVGGSHNVLIGDTAAGNYSGSESSNILIGSQVGGTNGESNVLRIGAGSGSGSGQLAKAFISGINGVTASNSIMVTMNSSTEQLGTITTTNHAVQIGNATGSISSIAVGTNGQVLIGATTADPAFATLTSTGNSITFTTGANTLNLEANGIVNSYTLVNTTPYTASATDRYLAVDSSGGAITVNLPNAPTNYRTFVIKDKTGSAATHNITVTTPGGTVTFDGATSNVISTNYKSISVLFDGANYQIY